MAASTKSVTALDEKHMQRCLALARRAEGKTSPNPMVGCVIVNARGRVVAEGYHRRLGAPHAEAEALKRVGGKAVNCTVYINLEPCRHTGSRRTPLRVLRSSSLLGFAGWSLVSVIRFGRTLAGQHGWRDRGLR